MKNSNIDDVELVLMESGLALNDNLLPQFFLQLIHTPPHLPILLDPASLKNVSLPTGPGPDRGRGRQV
jgi:hypothetical protein